MAAGGTPRAGGAQPVGRPLGTLLLSRIRRPGPSHFVPLQSRLRPRSLQSVPVRATTGHFSLQPRLDLIPATVSFQSSFRYVSVTRRSTLGRRVSSFGSSTPAPARRLCLLFTAWSGFGSNRVWTGLDGSGADPVDSRTGPGLGLNRGPSGGGPRLGWRPAGWSGRPVGERNGSSSTSGSGEDGSGGVSRPTELVLAGRVSSAAAGARCLVVVPGGGDW